MDRSRLTPHLEGTMLNALFYNPPLSSNRIGEIINEIYIDGIYQPYLVNKKDLTIIDCGANIGLFSQYVSPVAKLVYAIEPSTTHFEALNKMLEYNKITNVKTFKYAIANTNGEATFNHYQNQTMNSLAVIPNYDLVNQEKVKTIRLDTFFEENKIEHVDILKIDIEGEEFNVLGGDSFANISDKVDVVIGEVHAWAGRKTNQLRQALQERGYKVETMPCSAMIFVGIK